MAEIGSIPPWIKPADEADYLSHGLQIGAQIGAQQAAQAHQQAAMQMEQAQQAFQNKFEQDKQAFYQQEALKAQQLAAQRDARAQAELGLQAAAAARKTEALTSYQKAVQGGMDPLQAMLQYGPAMGQPATSIAAAQRALEAKQSQASAPVLMDLGGGVKGVRYGNQFHIINPQKPQAQWTTEDRQDDQGNTYQVQVNQQTGEEKPAPRAPITGRISQQDRDELREMENDRKALRTELENPKGQYALGAMAANMDPKTLTAANKAALKSFTDKKSQLDELEGNIADFRKRLRGGAQQTPAAAPKTKVDRANQLRAQHPNWTRQQIIDQVKKEFANASPSANAASQ